MTNMRNVMIDIETLDTSATAMIISIGAAADDGSKLYAVLGSEGQNNRTLSQRTVEWWDGQSDEAKAVFDVEPKLALDDALDLLSRFIREDDVVWGNGSAFDIAILEHAYASSGREAPWRFWNVRCLRTLKAVLPHIEKPAEAGVKHDALADACNQLDHLDLLLKELAACAPPSLAYPDENAPAKTPSPSILSAPLAVTDMALRIQ